MSEDVVNHVVSLNNGKSIRSLTVSLHTCLLLDLFFGVFTGELLKWLLIEDYSNKVLAEVLSDNGPHP